MFTSLLLQAAEGAAPASGVAGGGFGMLLPLILIVLIMYFFMIRPQNKKQKELQKMLDALKKGDKVVTIGGIHGTISQTKEKTVIVKVDDNTKIEFNRSAISTVVVDKPADKADSQPVKKSLFGRKAKSEKNVSVKADTPKVEAETEAEEKKDE